LFRVQIEHTELSRMGGGERPNSFDNKLDYMGGEGLYKFCNIDFRVVCNMATMKGDVFC